MGFAKWVYRIAGVYGVLVLIPGFFLEGKVAAPVLTHPEFYYGFYGTALVFQLIFLLISTDPSRWRPLMPITWLEKLAFFVPALVLHFTGRLPMGGPLIGALIDGVLLILFIAAWRASRPAAA